jgi:hypothetical protein|tara:strand:- start:3166 stop:3456 length:291 start_codon:yes stop_codon:yes gene_type:complete
MTKRGDVKPMDAFEESVRANAVKYNVVGFRPRHDSRLYDSYDNLVLAKIAAQNLMIQPLELRCVMIYAVDHDEHHALVGTIARHNMIYKPIETTRY